ncbi:MAG: 3-deoxy-8-phosphooctulonate synthase, partial [Kiritimatiellia bacterium]|nr:3-deoxy-8-phosphooctulonate synthase [Kiritimatiellia bacterium]
MRMKTIKIGSVRIGDGAPFALIAGPCVIESRESCLDLAGRLARWAKAGSVPFIFKASYDKANRTAFDAFRGPGLREGLKILAEVKSRYSIPILTDVHSAEEAAAAAEVADVIQIPAFLSRQTDLLLAAGRTGCVVNIKKGQFMAPWDLRHAVAKVESTGNRRILLTERGVSFGYNTLVADMRSLPILRSLGYPVVFDATHSVQRPGGAGAASSGDGDLAPVLARAAAAAGCDAMFMETHVVPARAKSDKDNAIPLAGLRRLWPRLAAIDRLV